MRKCFGREAKRAALVITVAEIFSESMKSWQCDREANATEATAGLRLVAWCDRRHGASNGV
jgi:hypothetical protein